MGPGPWHQAAGVILFPLRRPKPRGPRVQFLPSCQRRCQGRSAGRRGREQESPGAVFIRIHTMLCHECLACRERNRGPFLGSGRLLSCSDGFSTLQRVPDISPPAQPRRLCNTVPARFTQEIQPRVQAFPTSPLPWTQLLTMPELALSSVSHSCLFPGPRHSAHTAVSCPGQVAVSNSSQSP